MKYAFIITFFIFFFIDRNTVTHSCNLSPMSLPQKYTTNGTSWKPRNNPPWNYPHLQQWLSKIHFYLTQTLLRNNIVSSNYIWQLLHQYHEYVFMVLSLNIKIGQILFHIKINTIPAFKRKFYLLFVKSQNSSSFLSVFLTESILKIHSHPSPRHSRSKWNNFHSDRYTVGTILMNAKHVGSFHVNILKGNRVWLTLSPKRVLSFIFQKQDTICTKRSLLYRRISFFLKSAQCDKPWIKNLSLGGSFPLPLNLRKVFKETY